MSVTSGFFNSLNGDRRYNAEQMTAIFDGIINDGVFANIGEAFAVKASDGNKITVGVGRAWFNSTWLYNDAIMSLTAEESEVLQDRYDAVVIEINHSESVRNGSIKIIKGTKASSPQYPTMVSEGLIHQYPLAYIYRTAGSTEITQSDITYTVGTSACPFVTGILQVQSIDNIVAQWMSEWDELTEAKDAEFNAWFNSIKAVLDDDVATELVNRVISIENGTTPAGDSNKLGGHEAEYFAPKTDLANYVPKTGGTVDGNLKVSTSEDTYRVFILKNGTREIEFAVYAGGAFRVTDVTNNKVILLSNAEGETTVEATASGNLPKTGGKLTGGIDMVTDIPYIDFHYGSDETGDYTTRIYEDSKGVVGIRNGADPGKILKIDTTKLSGAVNALHTGNYSEYALPRAGGKMTDGSEIGFSPWNSASCAVGAAFYNYGSTTRAGGYNALFNNGAINCLSMAVGSTPWDISTGLSITASAVKWKNKDVHHDGNSAKVAIQSAAPSDTSALWVW